MGRTPQRLAVLLVVLGVAWVAVAAGTRMAYADRVLPGTRVAGIPLGGTDRETAMQRVRAFANQPVMLRAAGVGSFELPAREAGLALDPATTSQAALLAGREGPLDGVLTTPLRWVRSVDLGSDEAIDGERVSRVVALAARRFGRRPFDGAVAVDPATLAARVTAPRDGRSVQRQALTRRLTAALRTGRIQAQVPLRRLPAATEEAVERVAMTAERYVERPLRLRGAGRTATLSPAQLAAVLRLESVRGSGRRVSLGADPAAVEAALGDLAERFGRPAREPGFSTQAALPGLSAKGDARWRPRRVQVTRAAGRAGRSLDLPATRASVCAAVRDGRHRARAVIRTAEPATTAEAARRVGFLIGTFTTPFVGGQPRVQNIRRIVRAIDGTVVQPGQQFSLNAVAGPRTRDRGYVPAPSIADDELVDSVGGGVSQVATTLYNAAYFAGLRLDASQPHSFYIDRYPPGREATLSFPEIDLRWTNDTETPVVVRASTGATSVTVSLLGDNGGRRVSALVGERRNAEDGAFSIDVTRVVRRSGAPPQRTTRTTTYEAPPDP